MMKILVIVSALAALAAAKPSLLAPLVAPAPLVTASSSQYFHRINSGLAAYAAAPAPVVATAPYVAAPYVAAPYLASPYVAPYSASVVAV